MIPKINQLGLVLAIAGLALIPSRLAAKTMEEVNVLAAELVTLLAEPGEPPRETFRNLVSGLSAAGGYSELAAILPSLRGERDALSGLIASRILEAPPGTKFSAEVGYALLAYLEMLDERTDAGDGETTSGREVMSRRCMLCLEDTFGVPPTGFEVWSRGGSIPDYVDQARRVVANLAAERGEFTVAEKEVTAAGLERLMADVRATYPRPEMSELREKPQTTSRSARPGGERPSEGAAAQAASDESESPNHTKRGMIIAALAILLCAVGLNIFRRKSQTRSSD
jgi:hypothetical protein